MLKRPPVALWSDAARRHGQSGAHPHRSLRPATYRRTAAASVRARVAGLADALRQRRRASGGRRAGGRARRARAVTQVGLVRTHNARCRRGPHRTNGSSHTLGDPRRGSVVRGQLQARQRVLEAGVGAATRTGAGGAVVAGEAWHAGALRHLGRARRRRAAAGRAARAHKVGLGVLVRAGAARRTRTGVRAAVANVAHALRLRRRARRCRDAIGGTGRARGTAQAGLECAARARCRRRARPPHTHATRPDNKRREAARIRAPQTTALTQRRTRTRRAVGSGVASLARALTQCRRARGGRGAVGWARGARCVSSRRLVLAHRAR